MKAGLKRTFNGVTQDQLEISNLPQWKPLLFAVAFLHTTVQVSALFIFRKQLKHLTKIDANVHCSKF